MRRVTDAVCCRCRCGPSAPHNSVSLSAHTCRERNGENEGSLILPLFVLSSSPLHTSPRPPQITIPLSLLPTHLFQRVSTSPNQPTSSSLNDHSQSLFLPIRPPLPSLLRVDVGAYKRLRLATQATRSMSRPPRVRVTCRSMSRWLRVAIFVPALGRSTDLLPS